MSRQKSLLTRIIEKPTKELSFEEGSFKYRDRYYGFSPFIGEEIVWKNNKIVWSMNYYGKTISNVVSEKQITPPPKSCIHYCSLDNATLSFHIVSFASLSDLGQYFTDDATPARKKL